MKKSIRSRVLLAILFCLALFGVKQAQASHYACGDIWYDYIGQDSTDLRYVVHYSVYLMCEPNQAQLSSSEGLQVSSVNAKVNFTDYKTWDKLGLNPDGSDKHLDTLDQLCGVFKSQNSCRQTGSTYYAFVRAFYTDTVDLSGYPRATDWRFVWTSGARNGGIVNLVTPSSQNIWVEAGLNNLAKYDNSSPRYNIDPTPYMCINQPFVFTNGPSDPNSDKLRSYNYQPQGAGGAVIGYAGTYTLQNPIASSTGYYVDSFTCNSYFTPTILGKFVLKFRTYDYDQYTGVQYGYVSRDVQCVVVPCSSTPPFIDSVTTNLVGATQIDGRTVSACPGQPMSFDINAKSRNPGNKIFIRIIGATPPGSTFSVTPLDTVATGTFGWTPQFTDVGDHVIVFEVVDSTCDAGQPIVLKSRSVIVVRILPGIDAGPDMKICPLGDRPAQLYVGGPATSNYYWYEAVPGDPPAQYLSCNQCQNPLASPPRTYNYVVYSDDPIFVCKNRDTVTVYGDTSITVSANQDALIVCRPSYINFTATTNGPAPLANLPCGTANPINCLTVDQLTATVGQGNTTAFQPSNTPFYSGKVYQKYQFVVPKKDLLNAGLYSGTIHSLSFLSINPTVVGTNPLTEVTVSLGCVPDAAYSTPISNASFYTGVQPVANLTTYTITPNAWNQINFDNPYSWDTTTNLVVDICMGPMAPPNANGNDPVAMTAGSAIQRSDDLFNVCGGNGSVVQAYGQRPVVRFNYCPSPELPFKFTWTPGTFLDDSTVQNPLAFVSKSMNYAVQTVGRNGCRIVDTLHVIVPIHSLTAGPNDTVACRYQPVPLYATGGDAYAWYEVQGGVFTNAANSLSCTDCQFPIATPATTTTYAVIFTNDVDRGNPSNIGSSEGCPDTLFVRVIIKPLPSVIATNRDTTIKFGSHVQLFALGASTYTWTPVGSLDDPNSPAPIATPRETTTYIVSGSDSNQCIARDTVKVTVDYTNTMMIPSGFTPNNDGRNDYFKIVNPSFQKITEFRVFNRWGQEVFSTNDINQGWDGKWKGVDQPIGTYQYLIRLANVDGKAEVYKGDVTLIR